MSNKNLGCDCVAKTIKQFKRKYGPSFEITSECTLTRFSPAMKPVGTKRIPAKITIRYPVLGKDGKPTKKMTTGFIAPKFCPLCGFEYEKAAKK